MTEEQRAQNSRCQNMKHVCSENAEIRTEGIQEPFESPEIRSQAERKTHLCNIRLYTSVAATFVPCNVPLDNVGGLITLGLIPNRTDLSRSIFIYNGLPTKVGGASGPLNVAF